MSTLSPRSRLEWLALLALTVGLLASLAWFVHPWYDPTNDGAMYILAGRSLAAGEGYSMLGEPFRIRPPGFAVMIAPILALRGTDFFALNLLVSLFGVGGWLESNTQQAKLELLIGGVPVDFGDACDPDSYSPGCRRQHHHRS